MSLIAATRAEGGLVLEYPLETILVDRWLVDGKLVKSGNDKAKLILA